MSTTLVVNGEAGGFYITQGYGDSSEEPPPIPPDGVDNTVLGEVEGGLIGQSDLSPMLESE